jgi:hypothetical protein
MTPRSLVATALTTAILAAALSCASEERPAHREFETAEAAAQALIDTVKSRNPSDLRAIFGPDVQELILSTEPATARRNLEVFAIATAEAWRLTDEGPDHKVLVIGHEEWPFPIPLVNDAGKWRFDTAAGKEEVIARRIGRNELAVMRICHTYVAAQHVYAKHPHDGNPAGVYAATFSSEPGRQNGLYWPAKKGERRSPLGDLVARAANEGRSLDSKAGQPMPLRGYYFKILTAQGASASGGAKNYIVDGRMTGGFALVAWPAEYDITGVMTFVINQTGVLYQKDLGLETDQEVRRLTVYDPDSSWAIVP